VNNTSFQWYISDIYDVDDDDDGGGALLKMYSIVYSPANPEKTSKNISG
jgi:hypothetical protein